MEPDTDGRLKNSAKPHSENEHHLGQSEEMGLHRHIGNLSTNKARVTNRRMRDPYVRWGERRTPVNMERSCQLD